MYVGTCLTCGEEAGEVEIPALGHIGGEATCEEAGVCDRCGEAYIDALGHKEYIVYAQEETCTEFGWDDYVFCERCNKVGAEVNAKYPYVEIPATGHTPVFNKGYEAECEETGLEAHYKCEDCDQYFKAKENKDFKELELIQILKNRTNYVRFLYIILL